LINQHARHFFVVRVICVFGQGAWIIWRDRAIGENSDDRTVSVLDADHYETMTRQLQRLPGILRVESVPAVREKNDGKAAIADGDRRILVGGDVHQFKVVEEKGWQVNIGGDG